LPRCRDRDIGEINEYLASVGNAITALSPVIAARRGARDRFSD
jgi:hypothetical protein